MALPPTAGLMLSHNLQKFVIIVRCSLLAGQLRVGGPDGLVGRHLKVVGPEDEEGDDNGHDEEAGGADKVGQLQSS